MSTHFAHDWIAVERSNSIASTIKHLCIVATPAEFLIQWTQSDASAEMPQKQVCKVVTGLIYWVLIQLISFSVEI